VSISRDQNHMLISCSTSSLGGIERMEVQARKFYSQRNMYLCGFTLFLSLILNRTYVMILDVLRLEEEVKMTPRLRAPSLFRTLVAPVRSVLSRRSSPAKTATWRT
jgi:hypothetical protein